MKLFFITSRVPYPLDKGDKLRAYHQLKYLSKKHDVLLCCLTDKNIDLDSVKHLEEFCSVKIFKLSKLSIFLNLIVSFFSSKPYQVHYFYNPFIKRKIHNLINDFNPNHIYAQLIRTTEYVKELYHIPKTLDYMDSLSKGMERRINESNLFLRPFVINEHKRLLSYENIILDYFDNATIISYQDRDTIYRKDREKINIIKNGVDTEYFSPIRKEEIYDIAFVGNMNYPPNINAVEFLVNSILPLLPKNTNLVIAGATPHNKVKALKSKNVQIIGWVDDIREIYAQSKIFVAPMQIGTGLQNKLLEAMAMEIACVTTDLANNALGAEPVKEILIGNSAKDISSQILSLLNNEKLQSSLSNSGRKFVQKNYSWDTQNEELNQILAKKTASSN